MIKLHIDSRQLNYHQHFGQTMSFQDEYIVKDAIPDVIQAPGNVECTCITCCGIAGDKDNVPYDYNNLFNRIPHDSSGASPQDALGETVKNGLLPVGSVSLVKDFSSYWSAHTGDLTPFNNVRSAITKTNYPVAIFSNWYSNWGDSDVMPIGDRPVSSHMYVIEGWKKVNGVTMFQIEAWLGKKFYMPEEVFNQAISKLGCGTAVLSTVEIDAMRDKTLLERIRDAMLNLVLLYKQLIQVKKKPMEPIIEVLPTKSERLYDLAYSLIGKHLTLDESVPGMYGCAECISSILQKCGYAMPPKGYPSTNSIDVWLQKNCTRIDTPEFGCIINALTQGNNHGHIAINGHNSLMSNDSQSGTLESYWSLPAFQNFYGKQKGLIIKYYRLV